MFIKPLGRGEADPSMDLNLPAYISDSDGNKP